MFAPDWSLKTPGVYTRWANRRALAFYGSALYAMDSVRDERVTRRWFAEREAGWTPAERVRRAPFYACEWWACSGLEYQT